MDVADRPLTTRHSRWRTWFRARTPSVFYRLGLVVPKAKDCGSHEWHNSGNGPDACYHCAVTRPTPPDAPWASSLSSDIHRRRLSRMGRAGGSLLCMPLLAGMCLSCGRGPDMQYTYGLTVRNVGADALIVVPTNDGVAGPYSSAYVIPADGAIWGTWGEALGETDAEVLVLNLACQLIHTVPIPGQAQDSGWRKPTYLVTIDGRMANATSLTGTAQLPPTADQQDFVRQCPTTSPPMWTT